MTTGRLRGWSRMLRVAFEPNTAVLQQRLLRHRQVLWKPVRGTAAFEFILVAAL